MFLGRLQGHGGPYSGVPFEWSKIIEAGEACFLAPQNPGGSIGEAGGKLGEAIYFWGKHAFYVLKKCGKMGEAIDSSTLFIILKGGKGGGVVGRRGPYVAEGSLLEFYQRTSVGRFYQRGPENGGSN